MKLKNSMYVAAIALALLMTTGSASAVPGEICEYDGQIAFTYETVGLSTGWHMWECRSEIWRHRGYCGNQPCQIP